MKTTVFGLLIFFICSWGIAQESDSLNNASIDSSGVVKDRLMPTTAPVLLFDVTKQKEEIKEKKKKRKKKIYFGEKTRRGFIRQDIRDQTQYQIFHYTTRVKEVDPYIRDIYWYNADDKVIRDSNFDPGKGYLLHGPYERRIDDSVMEKGMYYFGTKHGRWMTFDRKNILQNKAYFNEGWPVDSRITYYNRQDQKLEKITPISYDLKEGYYYHFYENGQIAVKGEYHYDEKVGLWTSYWNTDGDPLVRKREIQYQAKPFTKNFKPYIRAEWDREGNLIYRYE
ncbi:hypothetical protein QWY93_04775 [Echinicola jeungdonensis]|uniref:Toxin-antitoxin system YwqK family antitoxin n=1 Tax=Echinicola jeungdonensis TaxID=709343 RepID=A0ABV5J548_9BACT|nr:hypothetical protein [Echinicola jeungdonensis]MDN3668637.1 hypothetical protein [Echinicola jeungdonensis]